MKRLLILTLLMIPMVLQAQDEPASDVIDPLDVPYIKQPHVSTCLVSASTMVLNYFKNETTHDQLWRSVRFWDDGTSNFEVQKSIETRGFKTLTAQLAADDVKALLRLGLPVICSVKKAGQKHAVVMIGFDEEKDEWIFHDPSGRKEQREKTGNFDTRWEWALHQTLLIWPEDSETEKQLKAAKLPLDAWRKTDDQYRAEQWIISAERDWPDQASNSKLEHYLKAIALQPERTEFRVRACRFAAELKDEKVTREQLDVLKDAELNDGEWVELLTTVRTFLPDVVSDYEEVEDNDD